MERILRKGYIPTLAFRGLFKTEEYERSGQIHSTGPVKLIAIFLFYCKGVYYRRVLGLSKIKNVQFSEIVSQFFEILSQFLR